MQQVGKYQVLKRLGGGGFGEVFLGEDPAIGRQVAIKVFKPKDENLIAFATSSDEEGLEILRARFLNEAKILASLENTMHIVNVLEYGEQDDGSPYYVMPYLPRSLADELGRDVFDLKALEELRDNERPRALPMVRALEILEQVLKGLATAHGRGLIHRDIKPSNIMLTEDDDVRIVDFGIAKAPDGQHSTVSHLGLGSRNYMAPEQRESAKHVDARADIYSVGRLAYRMLTGRLPVGRFADPNVAVPAIGKAMNDVILAALEEDREKRPDDASVLLQRFEAAKAGVGQTTGESDTGTWVGEGEAAVRDELKPLRAKIAEVTGASGSIPAHEKEGLVALAAIADLTESDLDKLIDQVAKEDKTLAAKQRLARSIATRVRAVGGPLDQRALQSLDSAVEAVGWDRATIKALMDEAVAELKEQDKRGSSPASTGDTFANLKTRFHLPLKPIAAVLLALLVLGGIGYSVHDWRQGQLAEAEAERQRQLAEQQIDAAWAESRAADTLQAYETFLTQWPDGLHQSAANERIAQLQEQGENTIARVQGYLNRLGYRVPEHGEVDTRTTESIRDFEQAQGLVVTGTPDEVVLEALRTEYQRRDQVAWSEAESAGTEVAYNSYLSDFPQGEYVSEVEQHIVQAREADQARLVADEQRRRGEMAATQRRRQVIRAIQIELRRLGHRVGTDGDNDEMTKQLISEFQANTEQNVTGQPSQQLLSQLEGSAEWPANQNGSLTITSFPIGAQVILNGDVIGTTELMLNELEAASYQLVVRMDGYEEQSKVIDLDKGQVREEHFILMKRSSDLIRRLTEDRDWCCAPNGQRLCLMPTGFNLGDPCKCGDNIGRVCR